VREEMRIANAFYGDLEMNIFQRAWEMLFQQPRIRVALRSMVTEGHS